MRRHETLEERARGSRVLFVVLALVMAASLVGFLGGLAEEHVAVAPPPPPPADAPRRHGDIHPALSYVLMDARTIGPNAGWPGPLREQAAPAPPPPVYASPGELAALKEVALARRAERRAYNGAPPVIPHPVEQRGAMSCLACHGEGLALGDIAAPRLSHPAYASCTQCHAPTGGEFPATGFATASPLAASLFEGVPAPRGGDRAWPGAPPTIPHSLQMRNDCLSCHGPVGQPGLRTSHPERTNCQQCHAPSAPQDRPFATEEMLFATTSFAARLADELARPPAPAPPADAPDEANALLPPTEQAP